ncbi:MAG: HK97 gp10 family phage protein [Rhizobiales bacterium]|nr:HK97 gp10 family phage protein [Hyphomicrobiales bacterium]
MVKGAKELRSKLLAIPPRVRRLTRAAMEKGAEELVQMMKRLVPVSSGDLRDSIGWTWGEAPDGAIVIAQTEPDDEGLRITVYAGNREAFYARFVEFGTAPHNISQGGGNASFSGITVDHPGGRAQPFFFPAYRALRKRILSRIKREMKKGIRFIGPDMPSGG